MNVTRLSLLATFLVTLAVSVTPAEAKPVTKTVPASLQFPHGARGGGCYARAYLRYAGTPNTQSITVRYFENGQPVVKTEDDSGVTTLELDGTGQYSLDYQDRQGSTAPTNCSDLSQIQMARWTGPASVDVTYDPNPTPTCNQVDATIIAKPGRRTVGTPGRDVIYGTPGNDRIDGRGGNDLICSGNGRDVLIGGPGNDELHGFPGRDTLVGGPGRDYLAGGYGSDRISGGAGNDSVGAGYGNDVVDGGAGNDDLLGGPDRDRISGGAGRDRVKGGEDNDRLFGGSGRDVVLGDEGNDVLFGGAGRDKLVGGTGRDKLHQ